MTEIGVEEEAKRLHKYKDKPRHIIVFSDFDPSGECISKDFEFRLKKRPITLGEDASLYARALIVWKTSKKVPFRPFHNNYNSGIITEIVDKGHWERKDKLLIYDGARAEELQ